MLELKNITKDYPAGDNTVHALKGISIQFRESEFVSILGPSGCGKTTTLNIVGGLDQYTSGDLVINGRSTKDYNDRDWDSYRNHSIGFVFQSYNLIPHQTVLQNVELALTLSGVSKTERKRRATEALEAVGLGNQLKKRPSQMSGGQMQRVAIARALVNNPDIILADEPTGALDSETSIQIMDLLKEVAKDRLVIMVTHNPELAEQYSTRIIRMLDGEIIGDSNPLTEEELAAHRAADKKKLEAAKAKGKKEKKPAMALHTAFGLSLKNLISKRGRTILVSFAGSIGIIGIALIYAVSQGMTTYINTLQEDTLSSYPLTIQATNVSMGSLMSTFLESASSGVEHENDKVYSKPLVYDMMNAMNNLETTENDLAAFKAYIEKESANPESETGLYDAISGIQYTYDLNLEIYTKNVDGKIIESDAIALMESMAMEYLSLDASSLSSMSDMASGGSMMSMMGSSSSVQVWQEMLPGENGKLVSELLENQYDVVYGSWPTQYNEIVLVLDENNEIDDLTLYALGLTSEESIDEIMSAAVNGTELESKVQSWTYQEICGMEFRTILPGDCYTLDEASGLYTDVRGSEMGLSYLYEHATVLKVSGIIRPSESAVSTMLTGSIGYTSALTEYVIENSKNSDAVVAQMADPTVDVITGLPFQSNTGSLSAEEKEAEFHAYLENMDDAALAQAYIKIMSIPSQETLDLYVAQAMSQLDLDTMYATLLQAAVEQTGMAEDSLSGYIYGMSEEEITSMFEEMIAEQVKAEYAAGVAAQFAEVDAAQLAYLMKADMETYTTEQCASYYDEIVEFSSNTYEDNLITFGCLDLDEPASISLYASTFESKDVIEDAIATYNKGVDELKQISYTDYVGIMMSSVTSIIDAVTYVLIAFVAISLIVSSIMIAVITLISVQERTKEIGILRAIGASKKNVSSMFSAETVIIGFASGALGVLITMLLCIPINAVIQDLTGIESLKAFLPWNVALLLTGVSILLNVIAGIIPSRSAAKKDPVVALRSE